MQSYKTLLSAILSRGYRLNPAREQEVGTTQLSNWLFYHDLREGFPLLTTKKMFTKGIIAELLWFMRGETNIKPLLEQGVHIWSEWPYEHYKKATAHLNVVGIDNIQDFENMILADKFFAEMWGDCGPVYGAQWRSWKHSVDNGIGMIPTTIVIDQLSIMIDDIKKVIATSKHNRRITVNAWNVGQLSEMKLPPCHKDFQVILEPLPIDELEKLRWAYINSLDPSVAYMEEGLDYPDLPIPRYYLNLTWNQRSVDTFLGLPFNIASYAILAHILAKKTNTIAKDLVGELRNVHIYDNHLEQVREQLNRQPLPLPKLRFSSNFMELIGNDVPLDKFLDNITVDDIKVIKYESHPAIKGEVSV